MTDKTITTPEEIKYRLERMEFVVGTFIAWSARDLGDKNVSRLISALTSDAGLRELKGETS